MRLADVPQYPAYFVAHDLFMNGAMDVFPCVSLEVAKLNASRATERADSLGMDGVRYEAYEKLPRRKVWKFHANRVLETAA
jgi:hypothetical protein